MINIKTISNEELEKISGGGIEWLAASIVISSIVIFLSGVMEGYTNPERCQCEKN